jgi:hypothetical protein
MGEAPKGLTLERINVDGNYTRKTVNGLHGWSKQITKGRKMRKRLKKFLLWVMESRGTKEYHYARQHLRLSQIQDALKPRLDWA